MSHSESNQELSDRRKDQFRNLVTENNTYPLATITYHGPGPNQATKIVVGIIRTKEQMPIIQSWTGPDIADDVESAREISLFLKEHNVSRVLTSEWVLSCPHEEGVDYPAGQACPQCPDWY
jgi:hypothetical protein